MVCKPPPAAASLRFEPDLPSADAAEEQAQRRAEILRMTNAVQLKRRLKRLLERGVQIRATPQKLRSKSGLERWGLIPFFVVRSPSSNVYVEHYGCYASESQARREGLLVALEAAERSMRGAD